MLRDNFSALSSVEPELLPIKVLGGLREWGIWSLLFCSRDIDSMTIVYGFDPYPLNMYPQTENELSTSRISKVIVLHTGWAKKPAVF